jgi:hypothetical protein
MSGGISAIKGFDYQATVILDRLFQHFDLHGPSAQVRPEGIDDLDLIWTVGGAERCRYEQIKKPTEDIDGNLAPTPWTLAATITDLLPNTIAHLSGNNDTQVWIVGDDVETAVADLVCAGAAAPLSAAAQYWTAVHGLARNEALSAIKLEEPIRRKLARRRSPASLPPDPADALSSVVAAFDDFSKSIGAGDQVSAAFKARAEALHKCLPRVLARTEIMAAYGSEREVTQRVYERLETQYKLQRPVIENTLFRNLRGFINDISKQKGRRFDLAELEFELISVWPRMIPVKDAPPLESQHIPRADLTEHFTTGWTGKAVEAVGVSGSGKTALAAEVADRSQITEPGRLVFYAEVRPDLELRDVLVGVAFHLRRLGLPEPFATSVEEGPTDEVVLTRLARSYSALPRETLLLMDLVEGGCSPAFARDLATFVRALSPSACRIAVFGQESALRELSPLERDEHGVHRLDVRGFNFDEFVALVSYQHPNPDRATIMNVHQRVTAGRAAGLFAKLAQSLARTSSLREMSEMAERPADDILPYAEQQRFARLSDGARSAAEKMVCFALPFRRKDAEEVFPHENVGAAVRELLTQGLLRRLDDESFEMHETVRAGLEGTIAPSVRSAAHQSLATWYGAQGLVTAEILHLEKAGKSAEARICARAAFLRGERWAALAAYVTSRKLVSATEVIGAVAGADLVEDRYLLSSILRALGEPVAVEELMRILREQSDRFYSDYQWAAAIVEAILEFEPAHLHELIRLSVEGTSDPARRESALSWLMIAARRKRGELDPRTIDYFNSQPVVIKRVLLRLLMLYPRRLGLQTAFQFLASDPEATEGQRRPPRWLDLSLHIGDRDDAIEFLAAIPTVQAAAMLAAKSPLIGQLASLIWRQKDVLRAHCAEILQDSAGELKVLTNAIRVLVFLADPSICDLCDGLVDRNDEVSALAALIPALAPGLCDRGRYEARLLDPDAPLPERATALAVLASIGADLGDLYRRVKATEADPSKAQGWDFWFLTFCAQAPFSEAIPLLEERLKSADEAGVTVLAPILMKLGELPVPAATRMLVDALSHKHPRVRQFAAASLSQRRSRAALASLVSQYAKEDGEVLAVGLATAIVASGPRSAVPLQGGLDTAATELWRCVLAMRTRDASTADWLVRVASDPAQHWQLRRSAIFAAGRLPYEAALERIAPVIMAERSPLTIDKHQSFCGHAVVTSVLLSGAQGMMPFFARGRAGFVEFFGEVFDASWKGSMNKQGLPSGAEAAGWLFDRLEHHGWPARQAAPDLVLNELNIPLLHSAVLRSLRLSRRPELIDQQLATADDIWLAMKCLMERSRAGRGDPALALQLRSIVDRSACQGNELLHRVIAEIGSRPIPPPTGSVADANEATEAQTPPIGYDAAVQILSALRTDSRPQSPVVIGGISAEQCERLIRLADPVNDHTLGIETYVPAVQFTETGHIVAQRRVTFTGGDSARALIRPAIAAANRFGLPIAWHHELLTGPLATTYVPNYLACLGALNDSDRFYDELERYEDGFMSFLCRTAQSAPVLKYIDARMAPSLARYLSSGTDEFFEGLCALAFRINTPAGDPLIEGLLHRWAQRFDLTALAPQHDENDALWRGFHRLAEHPRFDRIKGWQSRLAAVLPAPMSWYRAESIVRVLERDPRSYILIESRLFRAANWEHFSQDEIDRLDHAAERLFPQLLEA